MAWWRGQNSPNSQTALVLLLLLDYNLLRRSLLILHLLILQIKRQPKYFSFFFLSFFRACPCVSSPCCLILLASAGPSKETRGPVTVVGEKKKGRDRTCKRTYGRSLVVAVALRWWSLLRVSAAAITTRRVLAQWWQAIFGGLGNDDDVSYGEIMTGRWGGINVKHHKRTTGIKENEPLLRVLRSWTLPVIALARHEDLIWCSWDLLAQKKDETKKSLVGYVCPIYYYCVLWDTDDFIDRVSSCVEQKWVNTCGSEW